MTSIYQIFIIIVVTSSFCFLLFQMWYYIENYEYILKFNNAYSNLEYASSPSLDFIDKNYYDPNDNIFNTDDKWKCVIDRINGNTYSISSYGFLSESNTSNKSWNNIKDCILYTFKIKTPIVYNPCNVDKDSYDCKLYNRLITNING